VHTQQFQAVSSVHPCAYRQVENVQGNF
jgi:hypothetical protein